jgi:ribonuclease HII
VPDFSLERAAGGPVAGVDEVGRGPLAGPVVAAAVILDPARLSPFLRDGIADSKTLSRPRREALFSALLEAAREGGASIRFGAASVVEIDRRNILRASLLAMERAVRRLDPLPSLALIDGPHAPSLPCALRTVIRGDKVSLSIAAASIVAKVLRDRLMTRLAHRHPGFGWENNAGYGTAEHRAALLRLGITPHHRRSFRPVSEVLRISH